jgi:hypothetical protein
MPGPPLPLLAAGVLANFAVRPSTTGSCKRGKKRRSRVEERKSKSKSKKHKARAELEQTRNAQMAVGEEVRHRRLAKIIPWLYQRVVVRGLCGTLRISDTLDSEVLRTAWPARRDRDRVASNDLPRPSGPNIVLARAGTNNVIVRIRIVVAHTPGNICKSFFIIRIAHLCYPLPAATTEHFLSQ